MTVPLRGRMSSTNRDCEHDSVIVKHKVSVELPMVIRCDNVGSIIIVDNVTASSFTKHVEIMYKYMIEYVDNDIVEIIFTILLMMSALTKNLRSERYVKHSNR